MLGTATTVEAIGRDDLFAYLARHYTAGNMVLSAAGRVEHDQIVTSPEAFRLGPAHAGQCRQAGPLAYVGGDGREQRVLEQAHLVLGCEGIGYRDPDYFALAIYSTLFGGGMSSRLFQRIREERGLSTVSTASTPPMPTAAVRHLCRDRRGRSRRTGARGVRGIRHVADTLNEQELVRAPQPDQGRTLMALESSGARCEQAARHLIVHGRTIPYAEIVSRIEAVDQDAVRRVARRLLQGNLTLAAPGPDPRT